MNRIRHGIVGLVALLALAFAGSSVAAPPPGPDLSHGAVYTETNSAAGNAVAIFARAADGALVAAGTVPTGGLGTGAPLGSQGAVVLSKDGSQLFVVNAGDDTISTFAVGPHGLTLQNVVPSGGSDPISLTAHDNTLYVLNAGSLDISGFAIDGHGGLTPLFGSTQALSAGASSPEQIGFSPDGGALLVTNKGSNTIDTFQVGHDGLAGAAQSNASADGGPYGFDFDNRGDAIVSDAGAGAVSSYDVSKSGSLTLVDGLVSTNGQAAPCWLVLTRDSRFAYTANAGSGTISGYAVRNGQLTLLDPSGVSADLGAGSHPLDEAASTRGGHFFYVLADGLHSLQTFRIGSDGSLTWVSTNPGLPVGDAGLASG